MWKPFCSNDDLYLIKVVHNEHLELYLNDLKDIWCQRIPHIEVLQQFQQQNPMIDIKAELVTKEVTELINNIANDFTKVQIEKTPDSIDLDLRAKQSDFEVKYHFKFIKEDSDSFQKETTVPLIKTVRYLEQQQEMLCNLICKKDRELEEYKLEKGDISRKDLVTEKFDETVLAQASDKSMLNVFGSSKEFWERFVAKHGEVEKSLIDVEREPWNNVKRKRKVYNSKTRTKKGTGVLFGKKE